jgi:hypothetical protein
MNPVVSCVVVDMQFEAGQLWIGTKWTSDQDTPNLGNQGVAGFYIGAPISTADYNDKVAAGQSAWMTANAGVTPSNVVVGILYPALDKQGRALTKASGVESRTYGRYGVPTDAFDAPANAATNRWTKFPFDLDVIEGTIYLSGVEVGDGLRLTVAPATPLSVFTGGAPVLTAPVAQGDTSLAILPPVLNAAVDRAMIDAGWWEVQIVDGAGPSEVVLVKGYDRLTGALNLGEVKRWSGARGDEPASWPGFGRAYTQDAQVLVTRVLIDLIEIANADQPISFGRSARGTAPFPADVGLVLTYVNNGGSSKRIRWSLDVMTGQAE